jgi:hypothetical protein
MGLFLRLTVLIAIGLVVLVVLGFLLKLIVMAAIVAALLAVGFAAYSRLRRRRGGAVMTIDARRRWL